MASIKESQELVESCLDCDGLTKWEETFIESVADQLEQGRQLTDRQEEILLGIYNDKSRFY